MIRLKSQYSSLNAFVFLLLGMLFFNVASRAQGSLEFIGSTSKDAVPLGGAIVTLYKDALKEMRTTSNKKGKFKFDLEYGYKYTITFSYPGCIDMYMLVDSKVPGNKHNLLAGYNVDVLFFDSTDKTIDLKRYQQPFIKVLFDEVDNSFKDDAKYLAEFTAGIVTTDEYAENLAKIKARGRRKKAVNNKFSIAGNLVTGESSKPLVNKKIYLVNEKGEIIRTTISNAHGSFVFTNLPADQSFLLKMDDQEAALAINTMVRITDKNGKKIIDASRDEKGKIQFKFLPPDKTSSSLMSFDNVSLVNMKGKFTSIDNKPLAYSIVNLMNDQGQIIQTDTTDENGKFTFTNFKFL